MKAKKFTLTTQLVLDNLLSDIADIELNGKTTVTIGDAGSKSARQRGYEWILYDAIAKSGKGGRHEDSKIGVHLISKYRFALPLMIRDDSNFAELWAIYRQLYSGDPIRIEWFIDTQVHTEKLNTSQMAEYLDEFIKHYTDLGFDLPDPEDKKLLEWKK